MNTVFANARSSQTRDMILSWMNPPDWICGDLSGSPHLFIIYIMLVGAPTHLLTHLLVVSVGPLHRAPAPILATDDPFRPSEPPLEPMAINAIQELIQGALAEEVALRSVKVRERAAAHRYERSHTHLHMYSAGSSCRYRLYPLRRGSTVSLCHQHHTIPTPWLRI